MKKIICTFSVVGFHYWPQAPQSVSYLKMRHRHLFKIKVEHPVEHEHRAVEFHTLAAETQSVIRDLYEPIYIEDGYDFSDRSCETIASELLEALTKRVYAPSAVEVWEDDEHGARVECESS